MREAGLLFLLTVAMMLAPGAVSAAEVEILTPRPGSTILARKPETHLVLRRPAGDGAAGSWVETGGQRFEALLTEEDDGQDYLHFRVPVRPGPNVFSIAPGQQRFQIRYQPLHARLPANLDGFYFFHQDDRLPPECSGCHELREEARGGLPGLGGQDACLACHENLVPKGGWRHSTQINKQCLACHQQSAEPWRIGFRPGRVEDTCYGCHTGKKGWATRKYTHGPLTLGGCTLCHNPHGGAHRYQLWAEGAFDLCVACHSDKADLLRPDRGVRYVHGILGGAGCVICHDPHASDHRFVLHKPINELCVGCHPRFADLVGGHPVDRHPVSAPRELRRQGRELTCTGCHDPHGSHYVHLLIQSTVGGRFCLECHRR